MDNHGKKREFALTGSKLQNLHCSVLSTNSHHHNGHQNLRLINLSGSIYVDDDYEYIKHVDQDFDP